VAEGSISVILKLVDEMKQGRFIETQGAGPLKGRGAKEALPTRMVYLRKGIRCAADGAHWG